MLKFQTLASGSSGNASVVFTRKTAVLLDCGIGIRNLIQALRNLGLTLKDLTAVYVTHAHIDHIRGLDRLFGHCDVPVYASEPACRETVFRISEAAGHMVPLEPGTPVTAGELVLESFPTSHDSPGSTGCILSGADGTVVLCTDLGVITPEVESAVQRADILVCESNYDIQMLLNGSYPWPLKNRIRGSSGHLSNMEGARLVVLAARSGAKAVILGHLSPENNTPELALAASAAALEEAGLADSVDLSAAPRFDPGPLFLLEKGKVRRAEERP